MRQKIRSIILLVMTIVLLAMACAPAAAVPTPTPKPAAVAPTPAPAVPTPTPVPAPKPTLAPQPSPTPTLAPVTVKYGDIGGAGDAMIYVGIEKGFFAEQGLTLELVKFQSGPMTIPALGSGEIDVTGGTVSPGLLNAIQRGFKIKMVAGKGTIKDGFQYGSFVVRKDLYDQGVIKQVSSLKGRAFGVGSLQSGAESATARLLATANLTLKDVDLKPLGYADMIAAFANKSLDAAQMIDPFTADAVSKGLVVRWKGMHEPYGDIYQGSVTVFSEKFANNVEVARRFMLGYVKATRAYYDGFVKGINKEELISIMMKYTALKERKQYDVMQFAYLDPDGGYDEKSMLADLEYFVKQGYTQPMDLKSIVDSQFIDYAVQKLGKYQR